MVRGERQTPLGKALITARSLTDQPAALHRLQEAGVDVVVTPPLTDPAGWQAAEPHLETVDALVVALEPVDAALLDRMPRLSMIARPGVGTDTVDLAACTHRGITVTIAAGANHESVADFTFALMLDAARRMGDAAQSVRSGSWTRPQGLELWRKSLAIVGFGRIGQAVARRALGFEMRVMAVRRKQAEPADTEVPGSSLLQFVTWDDALAQADIVSLHVPLTPDTQGMVDAATIARMKRGSLLINTGRGGLVDEAALAEAVRSGHLAGAATDVLQVQGARSPSPLIGVPGITVTPHMAALTREAAGRAAGLVVQSILTHLRGGTPDHIVNPTNRPGIEP
jgi:phosphoglycerate dehydrogenase-like enzyme